MRFKKAIRMLIATLTATACLPFSVSCNEVTAVVEDIKFDKGYAYMWHVDGLRGEENRVMFQTDGYSMLVDTRSGDLIGAAVAKEGDFKETEISSLSTMDTTFEVKIGGNYVATADIPTTSRIIDSGRYVNRLDNPNLRFKGQGTKYYGRVEYVGTRNHMAMNYQLFAESAGNYDLRFKLSLDGYSFASVADGRGISATKENGDGFIFLKQTAEEETTISSVGSEIVIERLALSVPMKQWAGIGVMILPVKNNDDSYLTKFLANEASMITAQTKAGATLPVRYESSDGVHYVNIESIYAGAQNVEANRTNYDMVDFLVENPTDVKASPLIAFVKQKNVSITGLSPMLRNIDTQEPTGEQVQISKDWHAPSSDPNNANYVPLDSPKRIYMGTWLHAYTTVSVKERSTEYREYVCAYGQWGTTYAASHAQLSLVGYGGEQVWDQSALGSWGESVTYDPDICLNRSMIDDVRPFLVLGSKTGNNQPYNWSGNVGGADFLNYIEDSEQRIINQKIEYVTQAPCVTDVKYMGVTENGKIRTEIGINLGRTDDVVRNYYTLRYIFLEDVNFGRLSLFKIAADGYADNWYANYAYGDSKGFYEKDKNSAGAQLAYENGPTQDAKNDGFWFGLYNSTEQDEAGDVMMTVRSFNAVLNRKKYTKPGFNFFGTSKPAQMSCELTVPTAVGKKIEKGSVIEMVVEYTIIPNNVSSYYGQSDYLRATTEIFGTADALYQQVTGGTVAAQASVGKVTGNYPVKITAVDDGDVAAQFTLKGGLGYVPVMIDGLNNYSGYRLQVKQGGNWVELEQSVKGNDYWQTDYNYATGKYRMAFNVKNVSGTNFNETNEYRLIKK